MIHLEHINASAHPDAGRVDIQWLNPMPETYPGVRVTARESTHPLEPGDGRLVADVENKVLFTLDLSYSHHLDSKVFSRQLWGQFVSHRKILPRELSLGAEVTVSAPGNKWRITDGGAVYLIARNGDLLEIHGLLTASDTHLPDGRVYYYTLFPYSGDPAEYLFRPGNRVSAAATGPFDFAGRMYRMLPVIYHRYDKQTEQLRRFLDLPGSQLDQFYSFAKAALDLHNIRDVEGNLLPLLGRWIGWNTFFSTEIAVRRNELLHAPAVYQRAGLLPTLETIIRRITGWDSRVREFVHNVFLSNRPQQLNHWLCHRDGDGVWQEPTEVFSLDFAFDGRPSVVRDAGNVLWMFYHTRRNDRWDIRYKTFSEDQGWTPSQLLTGGAAVDKHPCVVYRDNGLLLFWNSYNEETGAWSVVYREKTDGLWSDTRTFDHGAPGTGTQRKSPRAVTDPDNRVWLFWLEKTGNEWRLKINRYSDTGWELPTGADFPFDGGTDARVVTDMFLLSHTREGTPGLTLFWARKQRQANGDPGAWEIAFREKTGIESITDGWGPVGVLPKTGGPVMYHDREPAAVIDETGTIQLFWASNLGGRWAARHIAVEELSLWDIAGAQVVIDNDYSQRTPLPFLTGNNGGLSLLYRSDQGISYQGAVYKNQKTTHYRGGGSIAVETRNRPMIARQGKFNDCRTYTYDTGENGTPTVDTWYANNTIGIYLFPDTEDPEMVFKEIDLLKAALRAFLPIQVRAVYIPAPFVTEETVYTYDLPGAPDSRVIGEQMIDTIHENRTEIYPGAGDTHSDRVPAWELTRTWSEENPAGYTVDFSTSPVDTTSRTWHNALTWE